MAIKTSEARKIVSKAPSVSTTNTKTVSVNLNNPYLSKLLKNKKLVGGIAIIIVVLIVLLVMLKSIFIAAMVNGEPITRLSVVTALEKQGGKTLLDSLITKKLILQQAKKNNINITQSDVDAEIKKITDNLKNQGTTLDEALAAQGLTMSELTDEIKMQLIVNKLVGNITVTEQQITDFVNANKAQMTAGTTEAQFRLQATAALKQQLLQAKTQEFVKNLQSKANILRFVSY
jgi:parvulin-like peptidyl-prolyl isomerase